MNPVTGLTFICSVISLRCFISGKKRVQHSGRIFATIVLLIGCLRIAEIIFHMTVGIFTWLFARQILRDDSIGKYNTMAPNTAICFVFIGVSLLTYHFKTRRLSNLSDYSALGATLFSFLSLVGYLYHVKEFYDVQFYIPMAFTTAICFFVISLAIMLQRSEFGMFSVLISSYDGSKVARFLLPFAIIVPIVNGKLRLYGERIGLYSAGFGVALFAITTVILFVVLVWRTAISINKSNQKFTELLREKYQLAQELNIEQRLVQATIDGQEKEKRAIGMELHDHINQILASTKMYIELAKTDATNRNEILNKSASQVDYAINEIRNLSKALVLHDIEAGGVVRQVMEMMGDIGILTNMEFDANISEEAIDQLSVKQQLAVFRIIQEQFNNIVKHAAASKVVIHLRQVQQDIQLEIGDNGRGFDVSHARNGIGLSNIKSRAHILKGKMNIESSEGAGTRLTISFPLMSKEPDSIDSIDSI